MRLRTNKRLDYYGGAVLMAVLKPLVWMLGRLLRRDHDPLVRGDICFIKMLGGGSLFIAYPALLGLHARYPGAKFSLITTRSIAPFADSLSVFHRIDVVDDSSLVRLALSGLRCLWRNFAVDTVVDLEVYSRLTTVLSSLTCARNRVGFYLETVFWRKHLHTHLIFFNRWAGTFRWYDAVARLLGAEPAAVELCQRKLRERFGWVEPSSGAARQVAIGHSCSDLGRERMLDERQWLAVFENALGSGDRGRVLFLGTSADRDLATRIIQGLSQRFSLMRFDNFCGDLSLADSLRTLASCHEFWGIDSALLHFARLLGLKCVSYWGPTDPMTRLRPIPGLQETVHYGKVPCSPCVHVAEEPPCKGQNVCIQSLFHPKPEYESISWIV